MKFFADTADVAAIRDLNQLGLIDGVTTNPSLILKSGRDIVEVTREICDLVAGPVSAEVVSTDYDSMMREADSLAQIADNICIKLPLTLDGLLDDPEGLPLPGRVDDLRAVGRPGRVRLVAHREGETGAAARLEVEEPQVDALVRFAVDLDDRGGAVG